MINSVSKVGFSAQQNWQTIDINEKLNLQKAATPGLNYSMNAGKNGESIPSASMSSQEALYGKPPEEKHTLRNFLLTAVALLGGGYLAAKHGGPRIKNSDSNIKKWCKSYENFCNEWAGKARNIFKKNPAEQAAK